MHEVDTVKIIMDSDYRFRFFKERLIDGATITDEVKRHAEDFIRSISEEFDKSILICNTESDYIDTIIQYYGYINSFITECSKADAIALYSAISNNHSNFPGAKQAINDALLKKESYRSISQYDGTDRFYDRKFLDLEIELLNQLDKRLPEINHKPQSQRIAESLKKYKPSTFKDLFTERYYNPNKGIDLTDSFECVLTDIEPPFIDSKRKWIGQPSSVQLYYDAMAQRNVMKDRNTIARSEVARIFEKEFSIGAHNMKQPSRISKEAIAVYIETEPGTKLKKNRIIKIIDKVISKI